MASILQRSGKITLNDPTSKLQAQFVFDDESMHTLQFHTSLEGDYELGGVWPTLAADITWSVNGGTVRRLVSLVNGMSISGPSDSVEVTVYDQRESYPGLTDGRPNVSLHNNVQVTIQAAKGTRPSHNVPLLKQAYPYIRYDDNGESEEFHVPPSPSILNYSNLIYVPQNVGAISADITAQTNDGSAMNVQIAQLVLTDNGSPSPILNQTVVKRYNPNVQTGFVQLAPGVTALRVYNWGTTSIYYSTTWGIDG